MVGKVNLKYWFLNSAQNLYNAHMCVCVCVSVCV